MLCYQTLWTPGPKIFAFIRCCIRTGFCSPDLADFHELYISSDEKLFNKILTCPKHILRTLLPPPTAQNYSLRNEIDLTIDSYGATWPHISNNGLQFYCQNVVPQYVSTFIYFRPALCFILVYNCGLTVRNKRIRYVMEMKILPGRCADAARPRAWKEIVSWKRAALAAPRNLLDRVAAGRCGVLSAARSTQQMECTGQIRSVFDPPFRRRIRSWDSDSEMFSVTAIAGKIERLVMSVQRPVCNMPMTSNSVYGYDHSSQGIKSQG